MKNAWISLAAVCALVIGVYAYTAHSAYSISKSLNPAEAYYNLLVQGFRVGQLDLKTDVPPVLAQLPDPYDPAAQAPYPVLDMSYYKGKLYLYFGVTPALVLFWPYLALTGHYLLQKDAASIFCLVGFLSSAGLLYALWRRYFAEVSVAVVAAATLALGLVTYTQPLLARCDVNEVPITCGYALSMLALAGIWKALHEPQRRCSWLATASLAYGLAVGARPSLLFGAVILLVPVAQAWRERRTVLVPLLAATGPMVLIGLGLMLYNALRFDSPFEFGTHYQLAGQRQLGRQFFSPRYFWFNFRVYFLEPARWNRQFPFVHDIALPPVPAGNIGVYAPFGILTTIPLVWLALAVPLAWRGRPMQSCSTLRGFVTAVAILFGICALTLTLFCAAEDRYEVEFLPALVLLVVMGILGLERALADQPVRRRAVRWGWGVLLGFSVAFNFFVSVERSAEARHNLGNALLGVGRVPEAIGQYEQALRIKPDLAETHISLGLALVRLGRVQEAIEQYQQALQIQPDNAAAHNNQGLALVQLGQAQEAIEHYEQALRINPDYAEAHNNLGNALARTGRIKEAIAHYEQALRINPDFTGAHIDLGVALSQLGCNHEAIAEYEQALRIKPDIPEAHYNLGDALLQANRVQEAIVEYKQALRINPDYAEAHNNLGIALGQMGTMPEAIEHFEQALRIKPDYPEAHYGLGLALVHLGQVQEAIGHWEQALRIKPDYAEAHNNLGVALMGQGRLQEAIGHYEQALRIKPDYADAHFNLGLALEKLGRTQEAIQHYEQALRTKPDFIQAQNALAGARAVQ